ncbi:nucleoside hydrolase [Clostridium sp. Marseille-P299]|uniref:nucleoside hydrolase n=1 Tax=Clostridium sp. Marseille-P299 TaxID=1805477 RepID=UPI00082AE3BD|nr:nucleoside hydrolase [Clostridium sp. Marseille-P299]
MRPILIDCDPGHDDAMAIMLALANSDQLKVLGITCVGGNQTLEKVSENALKVLTVVNKNIPVAKGMKSPLIKEIAPAPEAHGDTGMDGPIIEEITMDFVKQNGVEFLRDKILSESEKVTIVALGPLTNIALLLKMYPEVKERIECIAIMGGSATSGNSTAAAEFNFWIDPHAAHMVFHSGIPLIQAGTEVSLAASILHTEIEQFKGKGRVSNFVYDLLEFYSQFSKRLGIDRSPIFDACPVMYLLHPELFVAKDYYVDIELNGELTAGMSVTDKRVWFDMREPNTKVLLDVDREKFVEYLAEAIFTLDKELAC